MMKRPSRWAAGMLGLTTLLAAPLSSADPSGIELGEHIPYTVVEGYQHCASELPFRVRSQHAAAGKEFVEEYFATHPKAELLSAWIATESTYNPLAVSGVGASGFGQLMPRTARNLGLRTASVEELSCLTGLDESSSYASLLRGLRDAVRTGDVPYEVAAFVHEPFDGNKNLEASYRYLEEVGFGRVSDRLAFMRYHAGPSLTRAGPRTRSYPDKIFEHLQ